MSNIKDLYNNTVKAKLKEEFAISNVMAIPSLKKIIINVGIGDLLKNKEGKERLMTDFAAITGQKPAERKAKLSIATFSIREGMIVGLTTTLRSTKMYDFYDKFVNIVLPRLRDFRGVKRSSFDANGNYTIGLTDHTVFPEIDVTKGSQAHGFEITFVTNSGSKEKGERLLELLGMPFVKEK